MSVPLSRAQVNHLRRLLGWVRCDIGQPPDEMVAMMKRLAPHLDKPSDEAKQRLVESYTKSARIPKYVRQAIKSLSTVVREQPGEIIDAEQSQHFPVRKT